MCIIYTINIKDTSIDTIDYIRGIGNEVTCAHSDNTIFLRIP